MMYFKTKGIIHMFRWKKNGEREKAISTGKQTKDRLNSNTYYLHSQVIEEDKEKCTNKQDV